MSDLRELYQELILDHNRHPCNFGSLEAATHRANGYNPLCGDRIAITLILDGDRIRDIQFEGTGCAISTASASMLTESLKGKTRKEAKQVFEDFHRMVTRGPQCPPHDAELGKLEAFAGVCEFPVRVKCATLAWHTFSAALEQKTGEVTTE